MIKQVFAAAVLSALGLATAAQAQTVKLDGSSTVYPVSEAVAEEFQTSKKGKIKVTVGISGTGGGFKKFCRGETDISNASRPILAKEMEACAQAGIKYFELPVAFDALTVIVNPKNTWAKSLTVAQLKAMWEPAAQGKITNWNQIDPSFPNKPLKLYGPGADSGTFDYFTEAVVGKAKSSRGDFTASEDDNVLVQGVSRDEGGLAYFGYAYFVENQKKLKGVAVVNSKGKAIEPSMDTVLNGSYEPLARPIFIYVNEASMKKPEVKEFVEFYLKNASTLAKEVKYVPLPANAYTLGLQHLAKGKVGSMFGGKAETGVTVEELLKREAKL